MKVLDNRYNHISDNRSPSLLAKISLLTKIKYYKTIFFVRSKKSSVFDYVTSTKTQMKIEKTIKRDLKQEQIGVLRCAYCNRFKYFPCQNTDDMEYDIGPSSDRECAMTRKSMALPLKYDLVFYTPWRP